MHGLMLHLYLLNKQLLHSLRHQDERVQTLHEARAALEARYRTLSADYQRVLRENDKLRHKVIPPDDGDSLRSARQEIAFLQQENNQLVLQAEELRKTIDGLNAALKKFSRDADALEIVVLRERVHRLIVLLNQAEALLQQGSAQCDDANLNAAFHQWQRRRSSASDAASRQQIALLMGQAKPD